MNPDEPVPELTPTEAAAVPPAYRAGVAMQLAALRAQARLVEEFALPEEPAPGTDFAP